MWAVPPPHLRARLVRYRDKVQREDGPWGREARKREEEREEEKKRGRERQGKGWREEEDKEKEEEGHETAEVDQFTVTELEGEERPAHKTVVRGVLTFSWPFEAP